MLALGSVLLLLDWARAHPADHIGAASQSPHCDSQLLQTNTQHDHWVARQQEPAGSCFWTADAGSPGTRLDAEGGRESECRRQCIEQDAACPSAEGKFCSCAQDLIPPPDEADPAARAVFRNSTRATRLRRVSFSAHRAVAPEGCFQNFTHDSNYVVLFVFAGRRKYMHLLLHYVDILVEQCSVHEVHLWDYARDKDDRHWLQKRIFPRRASAGWQRMTHGLDAAEYWSDVYKFYSSPTVEDAVRWEPQSKWATKDNTVLVKVDDDIVYMNTSRFDPYVEFIRSHRKEFVVHANIVNNGVAAYYQAQQIEMLAEKFPNLLEYPVYAGRLGTFGWLFEGSYASELHKYFLRHREQFAWSEGDGCIVYGREQASRRDQAGQGRFSINLFGARWDRWDKVYELAQDPEGDEVGISFRGSERGLEQCLYTGFSAAHFSYHGQMVPYDVLREYEKLIGE